MILDLDQGWQVLTLASGRATTEIRISAEALPSSAIVKTLTAARKRGLAVKIVLGAKPAYVLDAKGQPSGPNRPYEKGPQGAELMALTEADVDVFIPPPFTEIAGDVFQPGVRAHAALAVIDGKEALVCSTHPRQSGEKRTGLCVRSEQPDVVKSLQAIHEVDFNFGLKPAAAATLAANIKVPVLVSPAQSQAFIKLLAQADLAVATSEIDDGVALQALISNTNKPVLVLSALAGPSRAAVARLKQAGFRIEWSSEAFDGTWIAATGWGFLGSQRASDFQLNKSRDVGIVVGADDAKSLMQRITALPRKR